MNLQAKKLELVQMILDTKEFFKLLRVEEVLKGQPDSDWWDEISEEERQLIERGLSEAEKGEITSNDLVLQEIKAKYLKKR
ncbi:MAG: hypothetical protein K0B09_12545 [Bacteroidales bacterium]|nr:hypothetical protein [Bacteroidales bacterium]